MKKLFSLLTLALLTLSVGATTVTDVITASDLAATGTAYTDFSGVQINTAVYAGQSALNDNANIQLRSKNSNSGIVSTTSGGKLVSVKITVASGSNTIDVYGSNTAYTAASDLYSSSTQGTKVGSTTETATITVDGDYEYVGIRSNNGAVYISSIEVTWETEGGDTPEPTVAAPVFNPNGGEITGSTEVTVSCATENASIYLFKVVDGEDVYQGYYFQSGTFYVNETATYRAYATWSDYMSDYTTVTFTKVTPTVATPTFDPVSGTTFDDELLVTISCATPGATILYEYGDVMEEAVAPVTISLNETTTITAIASLEGYTTSETATATYTKNEPAPGATYELVTDVTTLQAGDKIALVGLNNDEAFVMSEQRNNNFGGAAIVLNGNEFTTNAAAVITLEVANDTTWNLAVEGGYLYANSSSSNQLKVEATVDGNGNANAMITNGENNAASIVFKGTSTRNVMQFNYNNNNPTLFSCYATASQKPVYIYKQTGGEVVIPAAPSIAPESKEFTEPIEVTITNNDENGAIVKYALNDGEYATYEAPFTVSETTTVKAYADNNGVTSAIVEATYTYVPASVTVANLAEVNALDSAATFTFTGNIVVTHRNSSNIWVRDDANNSALIYQSGVDAAIKAGSVITPNWGGTKSIYLGETEIINLKDFASTDSTKVLPFERQTLTMDNYAEYVIIKNVSIDSTYTSGNKTNYVTNTGVVVRNNWPVAFTPEDGKTYNIIGVVSAYNGSPQLYLISVEGYEAPVNEVSTIAEAAAQDADTEFTYVSEAVVVYQNASDLRYTWIKDASGYGLIFDSKKTVPAMEQGTILHDNWSAQVGVYNGAKQFTNPVNVVSNGDDPIEVTPEEMTTVTVDDVHKYIVMKGQTLTSSASKTWANADGLLFYDKFSVSPTFEEGKTYDVVGMVTTYKVSGEFVPEIFIISATEAVAEQWMPGDVNHDHEIDVADVALLIKVALGQAIDTQFYPEQANLDSDPNSIDVGDVAALINLALGKTNE